MECIDHALQHGDLKNLDNVGYYDMIPQNQYKPRMGQRSDVMKMAEDDQ